jgi:hypothetical protein
VMKRVIKIEMIFIAVEGESQGGLEKVACDSGADSML